MKVSIFAALGFLFFFASSVVGAPTAIDDSSLVTRTDDVGDISLVKRFDGLDVILGDLLDDVNTTGALYNSTGGSVAGYCTDITGHVNNAITRCALLPLGYLFADVSIIVNLVVRIIVQINCTLAGLLALHSITLVGVLLIPAVLLLILCLSNLCLTIAIYAVGCLPLVSASVLACLGPGYLLLLLGLVI